MNERTSTEGEYNLGNLKWVDTTKSLKGLLPTPVVVNATRIFCSALRVRILFGPWPLAVPSPKPRRPDACPNFAWLWLFHLKPRFLLQHSQPHIGLNCPYPPHLDSWDSLALYRPPHLSLALQHLPLQWLWSPFWLHPARYWSSLSCWSMLVTKSTNSWSPFIQIWASSTLLATRSKLERRPWKMMVKPCSRGNSSARLRNNSDSWPLRTVSTSEIETAREEASGETEEESSPNCRS